MHTVYYYIEHKVYYFKEHTVYNYREHTVYYYKENTVYYYRAECSEVKPGVFTSGDPTVSAETVTGSLQYTLMQWCIGYGKDGKVCFSAFWYPCKDTN